MTSSTKMPSTDIFLATENDDLVALKNFVEVQKVALTATTKAKRTVAHIAAKYNRLEIFEYVANADSALLKSEDIYGYTPLLTAAQEGALQVVQYLVDECKVSANQPNKRLNGNTPIHVAARAGQLEVLKYLIRSKNKVDVNAKNEFGEPPCFLAAEEGHFEVIKFLAEETDADLSRVDSKKDNILFVCAAKGNVKIAKYLLDERKMKFNVNRKDGLGRSLAYLAAGSHSLDFLQYLVGGKGADVNSRDRLGRTPLHQAAASNDIQTVKYLLERGADPKTEDFNGKLPSKSTSDQRMKKYLERMERNGRSRRNALFETVSRHPKFPPVTHASNPVHGWLQDTVAVDRLASPVDQHPERPPLGQVSSSRVNSFLALLSVWMRWTTRSKSERAKYRSPLSARKTLKSGMDPLALSAILKEFHIT